MDKQENAELLELKKRVRVLESSVKTLLKQDAKRQSPPKKEPVQEEDLALLERLRSRKGKRYGRDDSFRGVIAYAGAATISHKTSLWMREHSLPEILDLDPESIARILMALGNASRIAIVMELLRRPCSGPELQEMLHIPSTGQLYHHLKELLAAGIISQPKRSTYEVSTHKLIPLLNILGTSADFFLSYSEAEAEQTKEGKTK